MRVGGKTAHASNMESKVLTVMASHRIKGAPKTTQGKMEQQQALRRQPSRDNGLGEQWMRVVTYNNVPIVTRKGSADNPPTPAISVYGEVHNQAQGQLNNNGNKELPVNPLTPNDHYRGRTTPLTSKRCILYIRYRTF